MTTPVAAPPEVEREPLPRWTIFSGVALVVVGGLNLVNGYTAVQHSGYFTKDIVYSNLEFWGWTFVVWGALEILAGAATLLHQAWGRSLGIVITAIATVVWMFLIFAAPFAAVVGALVSIMVLLGLTAGMDPDRA